MSREEILTSSQSRADKRARLLKHRLGKDAERGSASSDPQKKKTRRLSILESLPVELIEKIFLYSLNVNLPRASVMLNSALSSERIYRVLILLAFWDDEGGRAELEESGEWHGSKDGAIIPNILRPLDYIPLTFAERAALQSTVLQCRWCTLHRVLDLLPDLMNLTIQRHWVNSGIRMEEEQQNALNRFMSREEDVRAFEGVKGESIRYTLSIDPLVSVVIRNEKSGEQWPYRILSVRNFPEKLLSGNNGAGFGEEESTFLEILRIACGFNRSDHLKAHNISFSREAVQQGIHTALVQSDLHTLTTLLKIDEYFVRAQSMHLSTTYTLPPDHFRTAVRVSPSDPTPFQLLLRASAESVPDDDPEITQWAMDIGPPLGDWLLDLMMRRPGLVEEARENPVEGSVFYLGRANRGTEMGGRYLAEVLGIEELGSWVEERGFDIAGLWRTG